MGCLFHILFSSDALAWMQLSSEKSRIAGLPAGEDHMSAVAFGEQAVRRNLQDLLQCCALQVIRRVVQCTRPSAQLPTKCEFKCLQSSLSRCICTGK